MWKEIGYQTDNVHVIRNYNKKSHASKKVKIQNKMCSFSFVNKSDTCLPERPGLGPGGGITLSSITQLARPTSE